METTIKVCIKATLDWILLFGFGCNLRQYCMFVCLCVQTVLLHVGFSPSSCLLTFSLCHLSQNTMTTCSVCVCVCVFAFSVLYFPQYVRPFVANYSSMLHSEWAKRCQRGKIKTNEEKRIFIHIPPESLSLFHFILAGNITKPPLRRGSYNEKHISVEQFLYFWVDGN